MLKVRWKILGQGRLDVRSERYEIPRGATRFFCASTAASNTLKRGKASYQWDDALSLCWYSLEDHLHESGAPLFLQRVFVLVVVPVDQALFRGVSWL